MSDESYECFPVDVVCIKRQDGFFEAQATLYEMKAQDTYVKAKSEPNTSYVRDRAISYALAELATKLGGGR